MNPLEQLPIPLLQWFSEHARTLPWRSDPTPYHVWLSEIMLQQTRVAAVLGYYERFLREAPTVTGLAALPEERLLKLWEGLGYYNRARNLQKAARQVMEEFGGQFPCTYEDIRSLCGVGDYTAGAIASIAFGLPVPAVDGNVLRVVTRVTGDSGDITSPAVKRRITQAIRDILPVHDAGNFNQAMMELGAMVCLPIGAPLCQQCPGKDFCAALAQDRIDTLPVKAPKKPRRVEKRIVWLIFYENRVALRRRPEKGLLAGLWEFPNELEGTAPLTGWGIVPLQQEYGGQAKHIFSHIEWHMTAQIITTADETLPEGWLWCAPEQLEREYAIPSAFQGLRHLLDTPLHL